MQIQLGPIPLHLSFAILQIQACVDTLTWKMLGVENKDNVLLPFQLPTAY